MGTILLVDENPLRASMRKSLLEGGTQEIVRALNASEAFCLVESSDFARSLRMVIVENAMQQMAGPEFVRELRARLPEVPILVLSGTKAAESGYTTIGGVSCSQSRSTQELRGIVTRLMSVGERQYA